MKKATDLKAMGRSSKQNKIRNSSKGRITAPGIFAVILALVFITYGNSIRNDYNIDDAYVVSLDSANTQTKEGIRAIPEILFSRYNSGEGVTVGYRPMGKVTMAIEHSLWGNNPQASHFINLVLFALTVFLFYLFLKRTAEIFEFKNTAVLNLAVLFFIVHPIHTEVVCSIKNREEILAAIFMLSALLVFLKPGKQSLKRLASMAVLLILAFWSKETSFVVLGILPYVYLLKAYKDDKGSSILKTGVNKLSKPWFLAAFGLVFGLLVVINNIIPRFFLPPVDAGNYFEQIPYHFSSTAHIFPNGCRTMLFYIQKLIVPYPLGFYYGYDVLPNTDWTSWVPYAGMLLIAAGGLLAYRLIKSKANYFQLFWFGFFVLAIAPLLNFIKGIMVTGTVAERLVFISSLAFCVLMSLLLFRVVKTLADKIQKSDRGSVTKVFYTAGVLICIAYMAITIQRNFDWKDKMTLYSNDIEYLSKSARANAMLAGVHMKEAEGLQSGKRKNEHINKGKHYFHEAVTIYPEYGMAWYGLGRIYLQYEKNLDSARICFSNVGNSNTSYFARAREMMGDISYINDKDEEAAIDFYLYSFYAFPSKPVYDKLITLYSKRSMNAAIVELADFALELGWTEAYVDHGDVKMRQGHLDEAVDYFEMAIENGFRSEPVINLLREYYTQQRDHSKLLELNALVAD